MEIKVGMYVRTKNGITKIYEIDEHKTKWKYLYKLKKQDGDSCVDLGVLSEKDIVKVSHNIADLIEVRDYINGEYVDLFSLDFFKKHPEHIKSIVTHEQFKKMKYNVVNRVC